MTKRVSYTHFVASRTLLYHFEPFVIVSYNHKVLHREVITYTVRLLHQQAVLVHAIQKQECRM